MMIMKNEESAAVGIYLAFMCKRSQINTINIDTLSLMHVEYDNNKLNKKKNFYCLW